MNEFFKSWHFKVLMGIVIVLFAFMLRAAATGGTGTLISQTVGVITAPFMKLSASVADSVSNFAERYLLTEKVYLENEELKEQLRDANEKLVDYETIKRENEQFREFLELKEDNPDYDFETAMVIGRDATSRFGSFTIDKGSLAGIEVADPVITADGLVGIVWEVDLTYSYVRTVLDTSLEVGVYDIRTRDSGIVTGDVTLADDSLCRMSYIPRDSGASAGDLIVTSGIGGVFPKDLVVGTLLSVQPESSGISLSATVRPAADISGVTDVLVIKYFEGQGAAANNASGASSSQSETSSQSGTSSQSETSSQSGASSSGSGASSAPSSSAAEGQG